ncbi:MAG: DUF485 domain-containing protein [Planctomycetales bacterium]|nr:DUF485 domain-containing protein [Planctomycetales bacterium]
MDSSPSQRNRLGLVLFFIYFAFYGAFVLLNAYTPEVMERSIGGLNLAIWYGFALIIVALVMSMVYGWLRRGGDA